MYNQLNYGPVFCPSFIFFHKLCVQLHCKKKKMRTFRKCGKLRITICKPIFFCNLRIFPIFCRLIQLPQILYYIIFLLTNTVYPVGVVIDNKNYIFVKKIISVNFEASQIFYWRTAISGKFSPSTLWLLRFSIGGLRYREN